MQRKPSSPANSALLKDRVAILIWVFATLFVALFILKAIQIHEVFGTSAYDLGVFHQALWLISQFEEQFNTVRGMHSHGDHFRPVDYLFIPLYRLSPSIYWTFLAQSLSVGFGSLVLYRLAQRELPTMHWVPPVLALVYLLNPVVHNPLLWQYHPVVLASGLYLLWLWFYLERRTWPFYLIFILLLTIREDTCITTAAFAMVAIAQRRYRYGIPVLIGSIFWWLLVTRVVMPELNGVGYFRLDQGTLQVLYQHVFDIDYYTRQLLDERTLSYWAWLILPLLGLSLLAPLYLLPALPTLLLNPLVGGYGTQIEFHYSVNAMPFIFLASLIGMRRLLDRFPRAQLPLMLALLLSATVAAKQGSALSYSGLVAGAKHWEITADRRTDLRAISKLIGPDSGVAATDYYLPHLANRKSIYLFPNPWRTWVWGITNEGGHHPNLVDYLVLNPDNAASNMDLLTYLANSGVFRYIWKEEKLHVLQRVREERLPREAALADLESYLKSHLLKVIRVELGEIVEYGGNQAGCSPVVNRVVEQPYATTIDVDFSSIFPNVGKGSVYLHALIDSPITQEIEISLGVDDGAVVWLDQQELAEILGPQPFTPNQYKIPVQLKKGENRFCFRIDNVGGAWRIQAQFLPLLQQ